MPLKLQGELPCCRPSLVHHGHTQMQAELNTLELVPDMFSLLPPGGITAIHLSSPINLHCPQHKASLQPRIYIQVHYQMSYGVDCRWSQIVEHGVGVG